MALNKAIIMGRLTRDPDIRYTTGAEPMAIGRFTLAVDRRFAKDGEQSADFISCVAFGKRAEFLEKYCHKGTKLVVEGRIQTGSYEKDGQKVYTTDVVAENLEFAESKASAQNNGVNTGISYGAPAPETADGFMNIPEELEAELPFV